VTALPLAQQLAYRTRAAAHADIPAMVALMEPFIASGDLLPRTAWDLERDLANYSVAVDAAGQVIGMGALKRYSDTLAEVIALAVSASWQGRGVGQAVVERLLAQAAELEIDEVFALTRVPGFFHRLGFATVEKGRFPLKVWFDCSLCSRRHCCDEIAVHLAGVASRRMPA
jgi:N-acetylglutamate synthase-like GNAT family acetyltransferase